MDTKRIKISFILVTEDNLSSSMFWYILFPTFLYLSLCIGIISKIFSNRNTCLLKFSFTSECFSDKKESRIIFNIEHHKRTNYLFFFKVSANITVISIYIFTILNLKYGPCFKKWHSNPSNFMNQDFLSLNWTGCLGQGCEQGNITHSFK